MKTKNKKKNPPKKMIAIPYFGWEKSLDDY
jgi:hypothetical protein